VVAVVQRGGGRMSARDAIHERIHGPGYCDPPCGLCREVKDLTDAHRDEVALQLGRDLMEVGLIPFLERLVGEDNTERVIERHCYGD
jgi:hypothetical protein